MDKSPQKAIKAQCLWGEKDYSVAKAQEKKKKSYWSKRVRFFFFDSGSDIGISMSAGQKCRSLQVVSVRPTSAPQVT